jgi:hypothetical protein
MWESADTVGPTVYKEGTMLWKNSSAWFKEPGTEKWIPMQRSAVWEIPKGWQAYLTGGEIERK